MNALLVTMVLCAGDAGTRPLYYAEVEIGRAQLEGRTLRELTLMRNWIYATAGNTFRRKWLDAFFRAQDWYKGGGLDESELIPADRANAATIAGYEAALTTAQLIKMRDEARAKNDVLELRLISVRLGAWAGEGPAPADLSPLEEPSKLERLITLEQLEDMSPRDLKLLRNTIFARRGRAFTTPDVKGHFKTVAWYRVDPKYSDKLLSAIDKKNIQVIKSLEDQLKAPEVPSWFTAA